MSSPIRVNYQGDCAILTMDAGENRLNDDFLHRFHNALDEIEKNPNAKVLITTGIGKFYSNGIDLEWLGKRSVDEMNQFKLLLNGLLARILTFKLPTIAAVNGHSFAGGGLLFLVHDYRVMRKERGWFCLPEVHLRMRLPTFWNQICRFKISDRNVLRDVIYLGKRYTADEAAKCKLVDLVVPGDQLLTTAIEFGNKHLAKAKLSPDTLHSLKKDLFAAELEYSKL